MMKICTILAICTLATSALAKERTRVVLTNDDGWAVAMIRAQNDALKKAEYDVVLSCPADNRSGTGSSTAPPTILATPCEFDTCPVGSPPEGFNASDPRLNYVNSFPVDAVRFGIQTLAPRFFHGSKPDFVVSGSNVGNNLGPGITGSGTVGAASEATLEGIPSTAFSAATASQVSFTTLETNATSALTLAARTYAALTVKFVNTLLAHPGKILPTGITINVNYPATDNCTSASDFNFILTRISVSTAANDVRTCGTNHLPDETSVVRGPGCFASVSVFNATTKTDVDAVIQGFVLRKLRKILTCLPN